MRIIVIIILFLLLLFSFLQMRLYKKNHPEITSRDYFSKLLIPKWVDDLLFNIGFDNDKKYDSFIVHVAGSDRKKQNAVRQFIDYHEAILTNMPKDQILKLGNAAVACMSVRFSGEEFLEIRNSVRKKVLNNGIKIRKWNDYNAYFSGKVLGMIPFDEDQQEKLCKD